MRIKQNLTPKQRWTEIFLFSVFLLAVYFMLRPVNHRYWYSACYTLYSTALPVLAAFFIYFGGLSLGTEVRLLFAFWIWFFISRVLNGAVIFCDEYVTWVQFAIFFIMGSAGLLANSSQRERLLKWVGGVACAYYTFVAVMGVVSALLHTTIANPLMQEGVLAQMRYIGFERLIALDTHPNINAAWFFLTISLLVYFFFTCRRKLWRIPIVIAAVPNYLALGLTYCRNMKVGFSVSAAMLVMLLAFNYLHVRKRWQKAVIVVLSLAVFIPLSYKSFKLPEHIINRASAAICTTQTVQPEQPEQPEQTVQPEQPVQPVQPDPAGSSPAAVDSQFEDPRNFAKSLLTLSDRTQIFESAFTTLRQEPIRLLRGCGVDEVMSIAQPILLLQNAHFHNFMLQTLVYTGLAGFVIALIYCILLVIRMVRYFFSEDERATLPHKLLTLPLTGILLYNMLEPLLFYSTDFSVLFFFFIAGIFLGYSHELHPPKQKN